MWRVPAFILSSLPLQTPKGATPLMRDLCITPHLRRHFRDSGLVMCVSTLPSPSLSVPCIWGILQSLCRKSIAFFAKDHFAKVFYALMPYGEREISFTGIRRDYYRY